ncbi:MAG: ABC transporter ATP-binding protein [Bacillus sp. (in: firmicutes)]
MILLDSVTGGYTATTAIIHDLTFSVEKGEFFALLGPNGSGKTTIVRLMMGVLHVHEGRILIEGKPISQYKSKELARRVAVMTQENEAGLDFSVREIVQMGRYPYQRSILFRESSAEDEVVTEKVMRQTNVHQLRDHSFSQLSGGEKQRVLLAKALAQQPDILLLDEPTNHLDVRHTMELLDLLKELQRETGLTIVAILHDLNLASLYADQVGLLHDGKLLGTYTEFSRDKAEPFSEVYGVPMHFYPHPEVARNQVFLSPRHLAKRHASVEESEGGIRFLGAVRTISAGTEGKGFRWEKGWNFGGKEERWLTEGQSILCFNGKPHLFLDDGKGQYCIGKLGDQTTGNWLHRLYISKERNGLQVGILTKCILSESDLLNAVVLLTALLTEQWGASHTIRMMAVSAVGETAPEHFNDQVAGLVRFAFSHLNS